MLTHSFISSKKRLISFEDCMWGIFKNTYKVVLLLAFFVMIRLKIWKNMEFFSHWLLSLSVWSHLFVYRHQWFDKLTDYCWFGFQIIMYSIACAKNEKICPKIFWWIQAISFIFSKWIRCTAHLHTYSESTA